MRISNPEFPPFQVWISSTRIQLSFHCLGPVSDPHRRPSRRLTSLALVTQTHPASAFCRRQPLLASSPLGPLGLNVALTIWGTFSDLTPCFRALHLGITDMGQPELDLSATKQFHRAPIGFGPAPGPRQDASGERFDWSKSECTTVGVTYRSEHAALNSILPEGYAVDQSKPAVILFEVMELRNLPWLNGRGYNTWGVYVSNVICSRTAEEYTGSYMAVLFESFTDPISTGREVRFCRIGSNVRDFLTEQTCTGTWFPQSLGRAARWTAQWRNPRSHGQLVRPRVHAP